MPAPSDGTPLRFDRTSTPGELAAKHGSLEPGASTGEVHRVAGRIQTTRGHGKVAFADLGDWGGKIQLFAQAARLGDRFEEFLGLGVGDWVGAWGEVVTTRTGELSILVDGFELLAKSRRPWPDKRSGLQDIERRHRQRYLDLATNPRAREVLAARSKTVAEIRRWLSDRGFVEVETPMLHPIPGGALAKPFVTHHETLGVDLYLRIAPELYLKRLLVGGLDRVFEINRNFRNEGISVRHNPEFTMLEFYWAYATYEDLMRLTEELFATLADELLGTVLRSAGTDPRLRAASAQHPQLPSGHRPAMGSRRRATPDASKSRGQSRALPRRSSPGSSKAPRDHSSCVRTLDPTR